MTASAPPNSAPALEQRDIESLFLAEHTHIPVSNASPYPAGGPIPPKYYRTLDPFVALTAAAGATEKLVLGTGIALIPQRDPIITAKEVASLDLISAGRFLFGVGVGWNRQETANHGVDPAVRGRVTDERLDAMIAIWTQDEAEYHGEFVDFDPIFCWPKPVTKPYPPLYIGGGGPAVFSAHRPAERRVDGDRPVAGRARRPTRRAACRRGQWRAGDRQPTRNAVG